MLRDTGRHVAVAARPDLVIKSEGLAVQRAAVASGRELLVYGSSELYCCGSPYRATQLFASEPTGFGAFAVGHGGTGDLFFALALGALGHALTGQKLVVIDSPPWFFDPQGILPKAYAGTFSPLIAETFVFAAPLSLGVREVAARQMLGYPATLEHQPLLRAAVRALADPTPLHLVLYHVLAPLGRLEAFVDRVRDESRARQFLRSHARELPVPPPAPAALPWRALAARATTIAVRRDTTNPFGFPNPIYRRMLHKNRVQDGLARYHAGAKEPDALNGEEKAIASSGEWTNLGLLVSVLHEVGADPLLVSIPMPGPYDDYTAFSPAVRRVFYDRWAAAAEASGFPWIDFRDADADPYFLTDVGAHFSPRGYVFADRALDLYWHGRPIEEIRAALATLHAEVPAPGTVATWTDVERHRRNGTP